MSLSKKKGWKKKRRKGKRGGYLEKFRGLGVGTTAKIAEAKLSGTVILALIWGFLPPH